MSGAAATIEAWWRHFAATGTAPADWRHVQSRLIRAVHCADLDGRTVFVKTMTFPRAKDRLRYSVRPMPTAHEARLLRVLARAGVRCPAVLVERSLRRFGLPLRAMLVLEGLHAEPADPGRDLAACAAMALAMLRAGVVHRDLHFGNFLRLADGSLAVIDLQSARLRAAPADGRSERLAAAAWLLFSGGEAVRGRGEELVAAGLLADADEVAVAVALAERQATEWQRRRALRCFDESTQFAVSWSPLGRTVKRRQVVAELRTARWRRGGAALRAAWIGDQLRVEAGHAPQFVGLRTDWWRPAARHALLGPAADEAFAAAVADAHVAYRAAAERLALPPVG
ncbi:MAG: Lipopolysaccharide kinase (Kdo/WaaP) family [Planctomycetota bacterium]